MDINQMLDHPGVFIPLTVSVVCLLIVLLYGMIKGRSKGRDPAYKKNFISNDTTLPGLSDQNEQMLFSNLSALSMVESSLFCFKSAGHDYKTVYVSSCFNGEGKTISAISMAFALTINAGSKVLLIDGNPRSPALHKLFRIDKSPGLINCTEATEPSDAAVKETRYNNLFILPFGSIESGRPNLVKNNWLKTFSKNLLKTFDYIVFDGNSLIGSSDSIMIASNFDGTAVVIESEKTKWHIVKSAIERLEEAEIKVLGTVLNKRKFYLPKFLYGRI